MSREADSRDQIWSEARYRAFGQHSERHPEDRHRNLTKSTGESSKIE